MASYKNLVLKICVLCLLQAAQIFASETIPVPAAVIAAQMEFMQKRIKELESQVKALKESQSYKPDERHQLSFMELLAIDDMIERRRRTAGIPMPKRITS